MLSRESNRIKCKNYWYQFHFFEKSFGKRKNELPLKISIIPHARLIKILFQMLFLCHRALLSTLMMYTTNKINNSFSLLLLICGNKKRFKVILFCLFDALTHPFSYFITNIFMNFLWVHLILLKEFIGRYWLEPRNILISMCFLMKQGWTDERGFLWLIDGVLPKITLIFILNWEVYQTSCRFKYWISKHRRPLTFLYH